MFELMRRNSRPNMLRTLDLLGHDFDDISKMMDNLFHFHGVPTTAGIDGPSFSPALNFLEADNKYTASLELPGMDQKDIDMSISEDNILTITGEKKSETKNEGDNYCVRECRYGSFRREIPLPMNIKKDDIEATFEQGVLKLILPKIEVEKTKEPKKIEIKKNKE